MSLSAPEPFRQCPSWRLRGWSTSASWSTPSNSPPHLHPPSPASRGSWCPPDPKPRSRPPLSKHTHGRGLSGRLTVTTFCRYRTKEHPPDPSGVEQTYVGSIFTLASSCVSKCRPLSISCCILFITSLRSFLSSLNTDRICSTCRETGGSKKWYHVEK